MTSDLRTLGKAMREMDRKPLPDPGTKEWDDYRKLIAAFDAALAAEPAPAPDVAELVKEARGWSPDGIVGPLTHRLADAIENLAREKGEATKIAEARRLTLETYKRENETLALDLDADAHGYVLAQLAAAEARVKALREALEIIAGKRQCLDNLMGNKDVAFAALAIIKDTANE